MRPVGASGESRESREDREDREEGVKVGIVGRQIHEMSARWLEFAGSQVCCAGHQRCGKIGQ